MAHERSIDILSVRLLGIVLPSSIWTIEVELGRFLVGEDEPLRDANDISRFCVSYLDPLDSWVHVLMKDEATCVQLLSIGIHVVGPTSINEAVRMDSFKHERGKLWEVGIIGDKCKLERHICGVLGIALVAWEICGYVVVSSHAFAFLLPTVLPEIGLL
jgi:hypothetical protein